VPEIFFNIVNIIRNIIFLSLLFVLEACAPVVNSDYYYNEIVIRNNASGPVVDVTIKAEKTHLTFSCSFIPARSMCSNKFRDRKYYGSPIQITWRFRESMRTGRFKLKIPEDLDVDIPLRGILEVNNGGNINPYFEQ
jgi:hypothetical protein